MRSGETGTKAELNSIAGVADGSHATGTQAVRMSAREMAPASVGRMETACLSWSLRGEEFWIRPRIWMGWPIFA